MPNKIVFNCPGIINTLTHINILTYYVFFLFLIGVQVEFTSFLRLYLCIYFVLKVVRSKYFKNGFTVVACRWAILIIVRCELQAYY